MRAGNYSLQLATAREMPVSPTALGFRNGYQSKLLLSGTSLIKQPEPWNSNSRLGKAGQLLKPPPTCIDRVFVKPARKEERRRLDLVLRSFLYRLFHRRPAVVPALPNRETIVGWG